MLYSHNNQHPRPIPFRIVLSDGRTRTDPTTFTPEEIADAGYVPVDDPPTITRFERLSWSGTNWVVTSYTQEEIDAELALDKQDLIETIVTQVQERLDNFARTRQYDGILSACTYAASPTLKFASEGQYCVAQRDATWAALYQILAEVEAGTRPIPAGYSDIEGDLPALEWPTP